MAVRFAGTGTDSYSAFTNLPAAPFTVTFWTMIVTDRNTFSSWLAYNNGTNRLWLQTASDGTTPNLYDTNGSTLRAAGTSMTAGAWYRIGLVINGASTVLYQADAATTSTTAFAATTFTNPDPHQPPVHRLQHHLGRTAQRPDRRHEVVVGRADQD
jgi:hypothetical protein